MAWRGQVWGRVVVIRVALAGLDGDGTAQIRCHRCTPGAAGEDVALGGEVARVGDEPGDLPGCGFDALHPAMFLEPHAARPEPTGPVTRQGIGTQKAIAFVEEPAGKTWAQRRVERRQFAAFQPPRHDAEGVVKHRVLGGEPRHATLGLKHVEQPKGPPLGLELGCFEQPSVFVHRGIEDRLHRPPGRHRVAVVAAPRELPEPTQERWPPLGPDPERRPGIDQRAQCRKEIGPLVQGQHVAGADVPAVAVGTAAADAPLVDDGDGVPGLRQVVGAGDANDAAADDRDLLGHLSQCRSRNGSRGLRISVASPQTKASPVMLGMISPSAPRR